MSYSLPSPPSSLLPTLSHSLLSFRYLITFSVKLKEESKSVQTPCWICSEPPHKLVPAATKIFLHMAGEDVDVCWCCAGLSRVPDAPIMLAPEVSDTLEEASPGSVVNLLNLKWTEPAAPSSILLYVLECPALPEGSDDVAEAGRRTNTSSLPRWICCPSPPPISFSSLILLLFFLFSLLSSPLLLLL